MQLTRHTDYALRLLIHLSQTSEPRVQIGEIARRHDISLTHLMKVANHLAHLGFIETMRGRNGGIRLARPADQINLSSVICGTEPESPMVQCGGCSLFTDGCRLPSIFGEALSAFRTVLARYTLADLLEEGGTIPEIKPAIPA